MPLETSPKKISFDISNKLINKLLDNFNNKGLSKLIKIEGEEVPYGLPDIVLSKKPWDGNGHGINDKLGAYRIESLEPEKDGTIKEGTIVIFYETIWKTAGEYLRENPSEICTQTDCYDALVGIVTVHELVHWLMHYVIGFVPLRYVSENEIFFHEGFAQLFTWLTIRDLDGQEGKLIQAIFGWLAKGQPEAYRKYEDFTDGMGRLFDFEKGYKLLMLCKEYDVQIMLCLQLFIRALGKTDGELLDKKDFDIFKKMRESDLLYEYRKLIKKYYSPEFYKRHEPQIIMGRFGL